MDLNQLRAQVFQVASKISGEWSALKQQQPGAAQQLGPIASLIEQLEPLMRQYEGMADSFVQNQPPSQALAPEASPEGGSQGKISPDAKPVVAWLTGNCKFAKLTDDDVQNQVILVLHHVDDCLKGLDDNDLGYVRNGLEDIEEAADKLKSMLSKDAQDGIDRATD